MEEIDIFLFDKSTRPIFVGIGHASDSAAVFPLFPGPFPHFFFRVQYKRRYVSAPHTLGFLCVDI